MTLKSRNILECHFLSKSWCSKHNFMELDSVLKLKNLHTNYITSEQSIQELKKIGLFVWNFPHSENHIFFLVNCQDKFLLGALLKKWLFKLYILTVLISKQSFLYKPLNIFTCFSSIHSDKSPLLLGSFLRSLCGCGDMWFTRKSNVVVHTRYLISYISKRQLLILTK